MTSPDTSHTSSPLLLQSPSPAFVWHGLCQNFGILFSEQCETQSVVALAEAESAIPSKEYSHYYRATWYVQEGCVCH